MPWTLCLSTKVTSSSVLKPSVEFEPTTLRKAGGFVRLLDDDTFSFFLKLFHCIMPHVDILFSQLQKRTINSVFVRGIMQQFTQFFWFQLTLFDTGNSRLPNYKGTSFAVEGVAWTSPDGNMPQRMWTARAPSLLLAASIIFIFLSLKVMLQAKQCKEGQCNLEGWSRFLHIPQTQKIHISACRGHYNLGKHVFAYNSHTVWNLVSPDSLNGAE